MEHQTQLISTVVTNESRLRIREAGFSRTNSGNLQFFTAPKLYVLVSTW